jgi:hypothetical protein
VIGAELSFDVVEVLNALAGRHRGHGLSSGTDTTGQDESEENGSKGTAHEGFSRMRQIDKSMYVLAEAWNIQDYTESYVENFACGACGAAEAAGLRSGWNAD